MASSQPALGVIPGLLSSGSHQVPENISIHATITSQGLNLKQAGILAKAPTEQAPQREPNSLPGASKNVTHKPPCNLKPSLHSPSHLLKETPLNVLTGCLS